MPPRRDNEYMDVDSDSDVSVGGRKGKGKATAGDKRKKDKGKGKATDGAYTWEASYTRSWDTVQEDEAGSLQGAVEDWMTRGRRRRLLAPAAPVRRTIIRHLVLLLDLSASMLDRDMRPTRFDLTLQYAREFIVEWFDQNPLGQIGVVGMRAGIGERVGEMSGNPQDVLKAIADRLKLEPAGEPSLQNSIELARGSMNHLPTHSSREILIIFGSLTTCDPGNIHETLDACVANKIRISVVALAAEMKICRELCDKTGGQFGVALNEGHFKDLLFELIPPPAQKALTRAAGAGATNLAADLMMMGFPTRLPDSSPPSLCVCHSELRSEGFLCPRCLAKVCDVPTDCDVCDLMIVSSPHLARSYHHLFPVKPYTAIMSMDDASESIGCHGCARAFSTTALTGVSEGISPIGRYRCPECQGEFCSDCDVFVHDVTHVCPGSSQTSFLTSASGQKKLIPPRPDQEVISVSSASHITVSSGTRSIITVSDTSTRQNPGASLDPMESISSRGVARRYHVAPPKSSPAKQSTKHSISTASKSSFKRKAKADSDSEIEPIDAVIHIPRSPARTRASATPASASTKQTTLSDKENLTHQSVNTPPARKKARISSPERRLQSMEPPIAASDPGELVTVPSSQSDEQEELVLHRPASRDPVAVMEEVNRWRNDASSPISLPMSEPEDNMDVDVSPVTDVAPDEVPALVYTPESSPEPQEQPFLLTPQQSRVAPLPATPVALTEASKTAQIIADIKARAYAEAMSSPEDSPVGELKQLEDSDDEDMFTNLTLNNVVPKTTVNPAPPTTRYSLRDRGASGAASSSRASTSRKSPSPLYRAPPPKKKASSDPLGALLREKKRADKGGKGADAFRKAEDRMRAGTPLTDQSDNEDFGDWDNEDAAMAAVKGQSHSWGSSSPAPDSSDSEVSLNDEDRLRLLGEKQGKAVVRILDSDRQKREAAKGKSKIWGVLLWEVDTHAMDIDATVPSIPENIPSHPVLAVLKSKIDSGAANLLNSGLIANLNVLEHQETIAYLCDLALSSHAHDLSTAAFHSLLRVWTCRSQGALPALPFDALCSALVRLGANPGILNAMGWKAPSGARAEPCQSSTRQQVLYRLVRLVSVSTDSICPARSEIPDFVMALLMIGMDPSTSSNLQREIMVAVDLLCRSIAPFSHLCAEIEAAVCNKLVQYLADLQPINKAHLFSLLHGGSGRTSRIARWVAHAVIANSADISVDQYGDLPPLEPIQTALRRTPAQSELFTLNDDTDYDDLAFHIQILAVAVTNIPGYAQEDAEQLPVMPPASPSKNSVEKVTKLMQVRNAIEELHGRIVDTRAAHLDRSRAKAALKQLSMRIFYQQVALKSRRTKKAPRPIQQYFASNQKPRIANSSQ
ncbi:VWFA domain-containing protein [Favolaschia claudopus]|uniref:VWFA domain-containing protein n=1 Tax=Favolaschia claudopus TaxID=2862362 RepID=A0AAW0DZH7_9AGAR